MTALVGRSAELRIGRDALDGATGAAGAVRHVVYVGGPGAGKTAILDTLADTAQAGGALVLRAGGAPAEAELAYAGLNQLLRPALADAVELAVGHQRLLERVSRLGEPVGRSEASVAMAVLALLELLSRDEPLAIVVDDSQSLDRATLDVLAFVGRRAATLPMTVLVATRELTGVLLPGATVVELPPLGPADAQAVLDARSPGLDPALRQTILTQAHGNPLALVELPHAAGTLVSAGGAPLDATLPVTMRIQESFASRLDQLDRDARELLLIAACLESGELAELAAAARVRVLDLGTLDHAQELDLVRVDGQTVRFTHPMVATVVLARATPSQLRAAHEVLAGTLARQPARALRHRAAAATTADEDLATELETAAASLLGPGSSAGITATLDRAAALSVDPVARTRRLAAAADAARAGGRYGAAEARLARIDITTADPRTRLGIDSQRAWHQLDSGNVETALGLLVTVLEQAAELGRQESIRPAALAGLARWLSGNRKYDARLRELLRPLDDGLDDTTPALAVEALAAADATRDPGAVLSIIEKHAAGASAEGASRLGTVATADTRAGELARLADAALVVDAIAAAQALGRRASDQLRALGSFGALTTALATRCHAEFCAGDWAAAAALGHEVLDLAAVTGQQRQAAFVDANLAYIAAAQGRTDDARARRQQVLAWATPSRHRLIVAMAADTQLLVALAAGEIDLAVQAVGSMRPVAAVEPGALLVASACPDVVEALLRGRRPHDADDVIAWAQGRVDRWPSPTLAAHVSHARAVRAELADEPPAAVEAAYEAAVAAAPDRAGFAQGRLALLYGAWLRRARRASQARAHLTSAEELFAGLDAAPWVARARAELRATGQPRAAAAVPASDVSKIETHALEALTAQEQQVVELAAEGLSNRQIGERLFLSPKTVGSHLYKAFPKLGVSNRAQLRAALDRRAGS